MTHLEAVDPSCLRKSRRNSMIIMRAASQMNLTDQPEEAEKILQNTNAILGGLGMPPQNHKEEHHEPLDENDTMTMCVSALYGKLLVIIGIAFSIAKSISDRVPLTNYNSFYLYLYFGSIIFIIYSYLFVLHNKLLPWDGIRDIMKELRMFLKPYTPTLPKFKVLEQMKSLLPRRRFSGGESEDSYKDSESDNEDRDYNGSDISGAQHQTNTKSKFVFSEASHGSMYLKIGTVVFGIGSMIYSGLDFGRYFELRLDCRDLIRALTPISSMVFTFLQMYFIFLNSRVSISRHTIKARFGLMHMLATNLCVWINVLVEETIHTMHYLDQENHGHGGDSHHSDVTNHTVSPHGVGGHDAPHHVVEHVTEQYFNHLESTHSAHHDIIHNMTKRSASSFNDCKHINILGDLVESATPFLFPCTIEYSLLCAGVIYVMWKNVITKSERVKRTVNAETELTHLIAHKLRHHYSVDCARASRGLFMGIFVMVLTMITLILFYVLFHNENYRNLAILQANISEITIYSITIVSTVICMYQMKELTFHSEGEVELDNILLLVAQVGVYIFNSFTIIGCIFYEADDYSSLPLVTSIFALTQATLQTLLILQGSQRFCSTPDQLDRKPGREIVTFLLVGNLSMWAFSTFQTSRAKLHPTQLNFYQSFAWTIISHVSMPLAIFYRFHATVCLGEIWKKSYKIRAE